MESQREPADDDVAVLTVAAVCWLSHYKDGLINDLSIRNKRSLVARQRTIHSTRISNDAIDRYRPPFACSAYTPPTTE